MIKYGKQYKNATEMYKDLDWQISAIKDAIKNKIYGKNEEWFSEVHKREKYDIDGTYGTNLIMINAEVVLPYLEELQNVRRNRQ